MLNPYDLAQQLSVYNQLSDYLGTTLNISTHLPTGEWVLMGEKGFQLATAGPSTYEFRLLVDTLGEMDDLMQLSIMLPIQDQLPGKISFEEVNHEVFVYYTLRVGEGALTEGLMQTIADLNSQMDYLDKILQEADEEIPLDMNQLEDDLD